MKKFLQLTLTLMLTYFTFLSAQTQLGADMDGEAAGDESGWSVSLSNDGSRVAIGAHFNDGSGGDAGHVRVYEFSSGSWSQLGADIDGEAASDQSGYSVSLSNNGTRVAIGAPGNDAGSGSNRGHVRVYEFSGGSWSQLGADMDGEAAGDESGRSVSLSDDGTRVAIGAPFNGTVNRGHVRVFNFSGTSWVQLGADIDGEASTNLCGWSVSLSNNGTRVAIGAPGNDDGSGSNRGHVRVYNFNGTSWVQLGGDIDGEAANDQSGQSVSLSDDGTRVAIGALFNDGNGSNSGHVRVYEYSTSWAQLGGDIDGEAASDQSGYSVSLSDDGTRVAIGAPLNRGGRGHVRVYKYNGTSWSQLGTDMDGESTSDRSGWSVSISDDGGNVANGAHRNDGNGSNAGHVRVYENLIPLPVELIYFNGIDKGEWAYLTWKTASEINNSGFEIEHSENGTDWDKLGFLRGKGTSTKITEYEYYHKNPKSGINYYRLKQIDYDGVFEYSDVISIFIKNENEIKIYPNPAIDFTNIQIVNNWRGTINLQIINESGQDLIIKKLIKPFDNFSWQINISDLPIGNYHILLSHDKEMIIKSFVKISN